MSSAPLEFLRQSRAFLDELKWSHISASDDADHEISGKVYDNVDKLSDKITETWLAYYPELEIEHESVFRVLSAYSKRLIGMTTNPNIPPDIKALIVELLGEVNHGLYLTRFG